jgi:hypothetical protein
MPQLSPVPQLKSFAPHAIHKANVDAANVFELLGYMNRNASSTTLLKIRKQSALEEEEHEPKPETKGRAIGFRVDQGAWESLEVSDDIYSNEQRVAHLDKHLWGCSLVTKRLRRRRKDLCLRDFRVSFLQVILRGLCIAKFNVGPWLEIMFQLAACN